VTGFVYFIGCTDRVKIGYSVDPAARLSKINADAPWPCELLGYVSADDFPEFELHDRFAAVRLHGEWFALTAEIRDFIAAAALTHPDKYDRKNLTRATRFMRWRVSQKLTQEAVAAKLGVNRVVWHRWENEVRPVSASCCLAVEQLTGIPRYELRPDLYARPRRTPT
jgi:DNA-binding XRE family transcriptional regulator